MERHPEFEIARRLYEDALLRGLCHEGALEAALSGVDESHRRAVELQLESSREAAQGHDDPPDRKRGRT